MRQNQRAIKSRRSVATIEELCRWSRRTLWTGFVLTLTVSVGSSSAPVNGRFTANKSPDFITGSHNLGPEDINNPVPSLSSFFPNPATVGGPGFTLTVTGSKFVSNSVVRWNGSDRATTFVSSTELKASILAGDIAKAGTVPVTVFNPGNDMSSALTFTVNPESVHGQGSSFC